MAQRQLMTEEEMRDWILRKLGAPLVVVELTKEHLEDATEEAKRWFAAKKGVARRELINIPSGTNSYNLPDYVDKVLDVVAQDDSDVFYPGGDPIWFGLTAKGWLPYGDVEGSPPLGPYSGFTQTLQRIDIGKKVYSADPDWRQEGRVLYVYPAEGERGNYFYYYKHNSWTVDQLDERDHDLVKRFALASAKVTLARVRGKYPNGMPTAQGSAGLDADTLLNESSTEMEKLADEIAASAYPMGFMVG